ESNDRKTIFGLCFCNTLVMAAVNVVLPWSMWPIVPTLQCGFVRSNFSFAISVCSDSNLLLPLGPRFPTRDVFGHVAVNLKPLNALWIPVTRPTLRKLLGDIIPNDAFLVESAIFEYHAC